MITRRGGETVRLAEGDLVAAKVIPAAPARRRGVPAATVRELQETAARGWPAPETARLGEWTLRAAVAEGPGDGGTGHGEPPYGEAREGFTRRANSVLPLGGPGLPLPQALEAVERWYAERGLPPLVQVATGAEDEEEEPRVARPTGAVAGRRAGLLAGELESRGWTAEGHTLMRVGALAPLADREPDARVELSREPDEGWTAMYRRTGQLADVARTVLTGGPSVWFATVRDAGSGYPAAIGRCVVDGRWAGFAAVETAAERRREGLARSVMAELARRALDEGASAAYLQVEADNAEARGLYDALGFADHHAYHYRRAPRD